MSDDEEDKVIKKCKKMWEDCKNFNDLQRGMLKFLKKECRVNPWHLGAVDAETGPILDSLIKINELGLVTTEGQPGTITKKLDRKGDPYTEIQRGYMNGIIEWNRGVKLVINLAKTKRVFIMYKPIWLEKLGIYFSNNVPLNKVKIIKKPDRPSFRALPLTIEKTKEETNYYTNLRLDDMEDITDYSGLNQNLKTHLRTEFGYMFIFIVMIKQGDTTLDNLVLETLRNT